MRTLSLLIIASLMSACGSSPGGAPAGTSAATQATPGASTPDTHTYQLVVSTNDPVGFNYAPALFGNQGESDASEVNPGPEAIALGSTSTWTITSRTADVQVTAISNSNAAFFLTADVYKDGQFVRTISLGVGNYEDFGTF